MKLTMRTFTVQNIVLADKTAFRDGMLFVDTKELRNLLLKDKTLTDVSFDIARPGESVRIIHVLDAVEPRVKVGASTECFPGFMGEPFSVGSGITHRLGGMAVVTLGSNLLLPSGSETGVLEYNEAVIDMSGIGQQYSACSETINLCLGLTVKEGTSPIQYDAAVRFAALRAATYLARCTTHDVPWTEEEVLETGCANPDLPNIGYVNQVQSQGLLCRTFLYGMPMEGCFTPTLVDPAEMMDGAIVSGNYRNFMRACTYMQQNNPVARDLYTRHGKDLNFVGMVVSRGHYDDQASKTRSGCFVAKLATFLKAHACVLTLEGTGNANVDFMATVKALELAGIAAAPIVHEFGGPDGYDEPLFDIAPQAVSIISGGGVDRRITMPAMDKVIGGDSVRFIYSGNAFSHDDPHASRTATAHFYFCGYRTMQNKGFRAFAF